MFQRRVQGILVAQFDVYPNRNSRTRDAYPFLVDVQSPVISELATRIVIPLAAGSVLRGGALTGLTPEINYKGQALLLMTPQLSSVPVRELRNPVGSLEHMRTEVIAALDFAITGF